MTRRFHRPIDPIESARLPDLYRSEAFAEDLEDTPEARPPHTALRLQAAAVWMALVPLSAAVLGAVSYAVAGLA